MALATTTLSSAVAVDDTSIVVASATSFDAGRLIGYQASRATVVQSITATGTLSLPAAGTDLRVILNGTSVIALTIPVPTKDMDGTVLMIIGNGVAAHTLTFTGGLSGAGTSYDVITTNSAAPIALQAVAANGLWNSFVATPMSGTVTNITGGVA
jgi:hypothetical protein